VTVETLLVGGGVEELCLEFCDEALSGSGKAWGRDRFLFEYNGAHVRECMAVEHVRATQSRASE